MLDQTQKIVRPATAPSESSHKSLMRKNVASRQAQQNKTISSADWIKILARFEQAEDRRRRRVEELAKQIQEKEVEFRLYFVNTRPMIHMTSV